jgi:hypothetical protein
MVSEATSSTAILVQLDTTLEQIKVVDNDQQNPGIEICTAIKWKSSFLLYV